LTIKFTRCIRPPSASFKLRACNTEYAGKLYGAILLIARVEISKFQAFAGFNNRTPKLGKLRNLLTYTSRT